MAETSVTTPARVKRLATQPMRSMLVSRSSFENPRPFDRWVRTTSPSRYSTSAPRFSSSGPTSSAMVLFPVPERPGEPEGVAGTIAHAGTALPRGGAPVDVSSARPGRGDGVRTRSSPRPPSGRRGSPRPGGWPGCTAYSRCWGTRGRAAGCTARRARTGSPSRPRRVQPASGCTLTTPRGSSSSTFASRRVTLCARRMPVIQASMPDQGALQRLDLAQRAAAVRVAAPQVGALALPPAPPRSRAGRSAPGRGRSFATRRSRVSYVSGKRRPVSSSTTRMFAPSWCNMSMSTEDCICHEQVSMMRPSNRSTAHARRSCEDRVSNSSARCSTSARERGRVFTGWRLPINKPECLG